MEKSTLHKIIELVLAIIVPIIIIMVIPLPINMVGTVTEINDNYIKISTNGYQEKINISEKTIVKDATTFKDCNINLNETIEIYGMEYFFGNEANKIYVVSDRN